ncbi:sugar phosphate isomerase/epimerase family protein [Halalkalibacter akibai]|uniref:Xylose isomerase domain protein TIM barrel n=1 Tax=Halalkalibacter akibai (strain ATCC 43226 / DSM 21942 / CIP 109018 / JCM 9157 / 1139) TaxID=1236973 RepID=W4QY94_HALA3|nr:xylose isomerase domain protein TIM barrel [Halalkalibacter akibai JCM 9157]
MHGIEIATIGLSVEWRTTDEEFVNGLERLVLDAKAASTLGCRTCTTYILPSTDQDAAPFMAKATTRLRTCAQILASYGIRLGLEFVGPHHLRTTWKNPFIWNLQQTLEFIDAINERNVGLLVDAYHCYTNEISHEELGRLTADQIVHVHINDAKNIPVKDLLDNDRLYLGEGVIDLIGFLQTLQKIGYTGAVSQEVLTIEPPKEDTESLIKKSAENYAKLFHAAGIN